VINPITILRKKLRLSRNDLALILGVSYSAVAQVEQGKVATIPETWRRGLEELGIDYYDLQESFLEWREEQREAVIERLAR
jgi:transcriptional regulator with XRE-family HTH domain